MRFSALRIGETVSATSSRVPTRTLTDRFIMADRFAASNAAEDIRVPHSALHRDQNEDGPADRFLGRITEQTHGAPVPTPDGAVQIHTDDGIIRDETIDASCCEKSSARLRSLMSTSMFTAPTTAPEVFRSNVG